MVLLVTSDNEQFHADKEVVERSVLIKNMLEGKVPFIPSKLHSTPLGIRRWRERSAYPVAQCVVQRAQEGVYCDDQSILCACVAWFRLIMDTPGSGVL